MEEPEGETLVQAVKSIKLDELRAQVSEAALINELRSGERGKLAQHNLLELEAKCESSGRQCLCAV